MNVIIKVGAEYPMHLSNMAAPMKYFWDNTMTVWHDDCLAGGQSAKQASVGI